jgi:hypothetical protein
MRWYRSSQPPSTVGIARGSIDAGAVGCDVPDDRASIPNVEA